MIFRAETLAAPEITFHIAPLHEQPGCFAANHQCHDGAGGVIAIREEQVILAQGPD